MKKPLRRAWKCLSSQQRCLPVRQWTRWASKATDFFPSSRLERFSLPQHSCRWDGADSSLLEEKLDEWRAFGLKEVARWCLDVERAGLRASVSTGPRGGRQRPRRGWTRPTFQLYCSTNAHLSSSVYQSTMQVDSPPVEK